MKPRYRLVYSSWAWLTFENVNYQGLGRELCLLSRHRLLSGRWHK